MKIFILDRFDVSPDLFIKLSVNHELVRDLAQSEHVDMILFVSLNDEDLNDLSGGLLEGLDCVRLAQTGFMENQKFGEKSNHPLMISFKVQTSWSRDCPSFIDDC